MRVMSAGIAVVVWLIAIICLKLAFLAIDPAYRRDNGRWMNPGYPLSWRLIRKYPVRELGWFVASFGLGALMLRWVVR